MQNTIKISCTIDTTNPSTALGLEIWLDHAMLYDTDHVSGVYQFSHDLSDIDGEHSLRFRLKGKQPEHTQISDSGEILQDARIIIKDVCFDQIALGQIFIEHAVYSHDFNGTASPIQDKFYGEMGCNGTVELRFSTPVYLWLLEHM